MVDFFRSSTSFWIGFSISTVLSLYIKQLYFILLVSITMDREVKKAQIRRSWNAVSKQIVRPHSEELSEKLLGSANSLCNSNEYSSMKAIYLLETEQQAAILL